MIKIEVDATGELWHENSERDFAGESQIDLNAIKLEPNLGESSHF